MGKSSFSNIVFLTVLGLAIKTWPVIIDTKLAVVLGDV